MNTRTWGRGAIALVLLGGLVAALIASPVGAAITKKKVKKTATTVVNQLAPGIATSTVNQLAPGIATQVAEPLAARFAFARAPSNALDGTSGPILSVDIVAPTNGHLAINAGSDTFSSAGAAFTCILNVDGTGLTSSLRSVVHTSPANPDEDCSTEGAVAVQAGTHTVRFDGSGVDAVTNFGASVLWVMFVPFDGNGNLPTGASLG